MKMLSGAREGAIGGLRGLVARAMARDLCAFVVPGLDVARARGLDLAAAGLHRADTPRHANVLLIAGPLPPALVDAACVVWAQMPRPRAILALGAGDIAPLPKPDVVGPLSQDGLESGLADLRDAFVSGAFAAHVADFEAPALTTRIEFTCPMHPEVVSDEPGKCPKCGMFLVEREVSGTAPASHEGHEGHEKSAGHPAQAEKTGHSAHTTHKSVEPATYTCPMHPEVTSDSPGSCPKCGMDLVPQGEAGDHGHHHHHGHGHHAAKDHTAETYSCPMHPEIISDSPGSCPKCGMDLVPKGEGGGHGDHAHSGHGDHAAKDHKAETYTCPMHPEVTSDSPGSCPKCGMDLVPKGEGGGHGHHGGSGHACHSGGESQGEHTSHGATDGHEGHGGHSGHGAPPDIPGIEPHFMSMVDLTEGKPVSPDGLIMEWIDAPFGPFFPGLPGGLGLMLTLDGDSVAAAGASSLASGSPAPGFAAKALPDRLATLSPLAPVALRELACRALEAAAGIAPGPDVAKARVASVERERVASHLSWLADLARQTGLLWLERRAAALHRGLRMADADEIARRAPAIHALTDRVRRAPLLRDKLAGIGRIDLSGTESSGPVARASGIETDGRAGEPTYGPLEFSILTQDGNDAWARLLQRLAEIGQSLDLIARAGAIALPAAPDKLPTGGHGMAFVETPRGKAALHLNLKGGAVETLHLTTPFAALAALVEPMTQQMELAEALSAVGSLDLDPWGGGA